MTNPAEPFGYVREPGAGELKALFVSLAQTSIYSVPVFLAPVRPWIPSEQRPPVDFAFYECWTDCPPQSHPLQAVRWSAHDGGRWLTSWPVLFWREIERPAPLAKAGLDLDLSP